MFAGKSLGTKYRADGYTPKKPVMIIPGLCSSCLKVTESPYEPWIGKRIWLSMSSIGFEKMWSPFGPRGKKKPQNPSVDGTEADEALKRRWLAHMCLAPDGKSDPEGIKLRAVKGLKGCKYLDPGALTDALSYVMGPLAEMLEDLGYVDGVNLDASPYDWRLPPFRLEERDGYFSELQEKIEKMYRENDNTKVVIIAHSLGNRVTHYFVRFMEKKVGREWASKYLDNWLAIGPLWLGAPKLLRAIITGDRMGLEAFLFPHEGITLARSLGSTPWMFPYICPLDHEFTTYSQLKDPKTGKFVPKTNKEVLIEGGAEMVYNRYRDYYEGDPLIGTQDQVLAPPPIDRIYAIYGINLKTETFYFFKENSSKKKITDFSLDTKGTMNNFKCEGGIAYETKNTRQNLLKGKTRGGDGTVPYPSLSYCKKWKGKVNVKIAEIEGAEHREILKNRTFLQLVLEYVSQAPPPTYLPVTFSDQEYSVKYESKGRFTAATLILDKQYIRTKHSGKEFRQYYGNVSNIILDEQSNGSFFIDYDSTSRTASYQTEQSPAIVQEIAARCRYISEAKASYTEDRNEYGQTALHTAAINNQLTEAMDLLKGQIDINAVDLSGNTPLIAAAEKGNLDMMIVLLQQNNIDVNKQANNNKSVIHHMCNMRIISDSDTKKWKSVMENLQSKGIDLNAVADFGETPLHQAIKSGKYPIVEWLIGNSCQLNAPNNIGETPLHYAVRIGNKEIVELLLKNGADRHLEAPNIGSALALAKKTDVNLMAFIRDFSGDNSRQTNTVRVSETVVGGVRDEHGRTPLHIAASEDRLDQVFALQLKNASVNDTDKNGYTPLHCAATNGHLDVLTVLLNSYGVDVNCQTNSGNTILHYLMRLKYFETPSIEENYIRCLDLLKQKGVSLNITASRGMTPLHEASLLGNCIGAKWLLDNGAKIHTTSSIGFTPIHFAVQCASLELVKLLVEYGANPTMKTQAGTALDMAKTVDPAIHQYLSSVPAPKAGAIPSRPPRRSIASSHRFQKQPSQVDLSNADEDDEEEEVIYTLDDQAEEEYVPGSTSAVIPLAQRRQSTIRSRPTYSVIFKKPPVGSRPAPPPRAAPAGPPRGGSGSNIRKPGGAPPPGRPPNRNALSRSTPQRKPSLTNSGGSVLPPKPSPEVPLRKSNPEETPVRVGNARGTPPSARARPPGRGGPGRGRGGGGSLRTAPKAFPTPPAGPKSPTVQPANPLNATPAATPAAPVGCKFCTECGVPRVPGSKFCGECGLRF